MEGLGAAGSVVGIASFGIQVCQGLASYYHDYKDYDSDISEAYNAISSLSKTLGLLRDSLHDKTLDAERAERVKTCLRSCEDDLLKLSDRLQDLRKHPVPQNARQKLRTKGQQAIYPFRAETLAKLQTNVKAVHQRLGLALQVLQLDTLTAIDAAVSALSIQQKSFLDAQRSEIYRDIVDWLAPPDPWTNHNSARKLHEAQTGQWMLQSEQYRKWREGSARHLWMYGKAGCGKTVLSSTAVEDIRSHCQTLENAASAIFYFSFSDERKQSYDDLIRSLVAQLGWREPGLQMLRQLYERPNRTTASADELEAVLKASIGAFDSVFILVDALDECPDRADIRSTMLECLESLAHECPNLKIFATSRDESDIRQSMNQHQAQSMQIATSAVDTDIRQYVAHEIQRHRRLARLTQTSKDEVESILVQRADGMFRWAYCQLHELKRLKDLRPSYVRKALNNLPPTLDETYVRMLTNIDEIYRHDALALLRWLAYAREPPRLQEMVDAVVIDSDSGDVDLNDRGYIDGPLILLPGLVVAIRDDNDSQEDSESESSAGNVHSTQDVRNEEPHENQMRSISSNANDPTGSNDKFNSHTRIRLAHFSLKEFLESRRILDSKADWFHLDPTPAHGFIALSCLHYIMSYSNSDEKTSTEQDLDSWPLLRYAASAWYHHWGLGSDAKLVRVASDFFLSSSFMEDWARIHIPESPNSPPFGNTSILWRRRPGNGLYCAAWLGAEDIVLDLIKRGHPVDSVSGRMKRPLTIAASRGHSGTVRLLLDRGAGVNFDEENYFESSTALVEAAYAGHDDIVRMLLDGGADVNWLAPKAAYTATALMAACRQGHASTVSLLLERGAKINAVAFEGAVPTALAAACDEGRVEIVQILLDKGADVNVINPGCAMPTALIAARQSRRTDIVKLLLHRGAK